MKQLLEYEKEIEIWDLWNLDRKTKWFDEHESENFRFIIWDQCDDPICVAKFHISEIDTRDLLEEYTQGKHPQYLFK